MYRSREDDPGELEIFLRVSTEGRCFMVVDTGVMHIGVGVLLQGNTTRRSRGGWENLCLVSSACWNLM